MVLLLDDTSQLNEHSHNKNKKYMYGMQVSALSCPVSTVMYIDTNAMDSVICLFVCFLYS